MLDFDLAEMCQIEKRTLNQAVKRNIKRFPSDFMFQLSTDEWLNLKSQFVISSWGGSRGLPYAFSEQGLAMLCGVLKSDVAIEVNMSIMRVFVYLRRLVIENDPFFSNFTKRTKPFPILKVKQILIKLIIIISLLLSKQIKESSNDQG